MPASVLVLVLVACGVSTDASVDAPASSPTDGPQAPDLGAICVCDAPPGWPYDGGDAHATDAVPSSTAINDFLYFINGPDPAAIAATDYDLVVVDYSADGSEAGELSAAAVALMRSRPAGGTRPVLAYLSIGEAEDYRFYWDLAWNADPPAWLGDENPDWPGNYKVRFWDPAWQAIIFSYLDRILAAGFDGIYLDIVDAYYYWGEEAPAGDRIATDDAARRMIDFLAALADRARAARPGFQVVPQNAIFVHWDAEDDDAQASYFATIDAVGVEDAWYRGDADQDNPRDPDEIALAELSASFTSRDLPILAIEYLTERDTIDAFYADARARGQVPFAGRRALDGIPDYPGPSP